MTLTNIINQGKEKFYEIIGKASTSFPYANDIMHAGTIGAIPFLIGKYGSEKLGQKIPFLKKHSTAIGLASSALAEVLWQYVIEPSSPYDHPSDVISDYKGIAETAAGSGLSYLITKHKKTFEKATR